ncbi:hypothetical protein [Agrococcus sediminis]|uniref:hypothetical protein n=1 Tax=Agrococcus sediminis TaxID=2599924 RepID=UPI003413C39C
MQTVPRLDVSSLDRPLSGDDVRRTRAWLTAAGQHDPRLRLVLWVTIPIGVLMLLVSLMGVTSGDAEMAIVCGLFGAFCLGLAVWIVVTRRLAVRRQAKLLRFARDNALGAIARSTDHRAGSLVLQSGVDRIVEHALLGGSAMFGGFAMRESFGRAPWLRWGFLTIIVERRPGRAIWVQMLDAERSTTPVTRRLAIEDAERAQRAGLATRVERRGSWEVTLSAETAGEPIDAAVGAVPAGLLELLAAEPGRLALDCSGTSVTVLAERGWDLTKPETQRFVHRVRELVAASGMQPIQAHLFYGSHEALAAAEARSAAPLAFGDSQDPASRRRRRGKWLWAALSVATLIAGALALALVRPG